ncbi:MAG: anaerobic ribonucleoside-triphosphate reductase activating protein [Deltaproteobacteria bacterium]|nr:anaerobic ribonucleoside-triphosphate reductase activating protein [Deltaproteobacteria bacterium]
MLFGGLQKNSLIDYPGKISCVIFLSGCNFDCPYCHNPDLVNGCMECPTLLEEDGFYDFLESRRNFLDGVVISGGEPTIQKDLGPLCEKIKNMGYSIKLDTNGSRPRAIKQLIDYGLVDYIAMDIKTDPLCYDPIIKRDYNPEDLLSSIQVIMESAPAYEFRTTCVKGLVDKTIIEDIAKLIQGARLYALQLFHDTTVLHPEFFHEADYYEEDDLMHLKAVAEPWVRECIVR